MATVLALACIGWLASVVAVLAFASYDGARRSDAIVVLGAAQYAGRPSPVLRARIDHALVLYREGMAPTLVFTGGVGAGDTTSEAVVSAAYARRRGVPSNAILLETEGRTTSESIRSVAATLGARHETSVVLVSDPFHMFRLWILARRHGLRASTSPTRSSPIWASAPASAAYILSES
ncbi:MAG TPA: YdcF family protein, partial [Candidatus Elarobacter sp.]|nr:YdcF family protein [Candidatus Elarobacter sp.]